MGTGSRDGDKDKDEDRAGHRNRIGMRMGCQ